MPRPTAASRVMPIDWSTRPISSMATQRLVKSPSSPAPPYSSGAVRPNSPSSPMVRTRSTGKWWALSHAATFGAISFSAKSRMLRRKASCSGVSSKDMGSVSRLGQPAAHRTYVAAMTDAIAVSGLVKDFGRFRALDGLDLSVAAGEVHGFLGPNGAGKSTTIRSLLGLLGVDGGTAQVFGLDPWRDAVAIHRRLAYVPGDVALWPNLSGGETIDLLVRMRGADPEAPDSRRAELLERFQLDPTKRGRAYSKGNRQKVALVAAFATRSDLLILDEPTSGLDPLMEQVFNECVAEHTAAGATVLLSSHILSEVERLADRVTIIRDGRAVESGTLEAMRPLHRSRVRADVVDAVPDLSDVPGVHDLTVEGSVVSCTVEPEALPAVLTAI